MKIYADVPARRARQVAVDVSVVCWSVFWAWLGSTVHDATMALAAPAQRLEQAGGSFRAGMNQAGDTVDNLPVLQDRVAEPFRSVAGVGSQIEGAGRDMVTAITHLATVLGWSTALVPILIVGGAWLGLRARYVRRASAAQRIMAAGGDLDLLALRALSRQPLHRVTSAHPRPGQGWRDGDRDAVHALATLELRSLGLLPPGSPELIA